MPPWAIAAIVMLALAVVCYPGNVLRFQSMRRLRRRPPSVGAWRNAFPSRAPEEIEAFLQIFVDAFGIGRRHSRVLRPEDRLRALYLMMNPPNWTMADTMEYELFAMDLKKEYGVVLQDFLSEDTTVGEVFDRTKEA